ncbi:hypothetical protein C4577_06170 [Candidatus Parcubacteria bacterium]|nr:MAG: hypothetical protein C4577_06170 [Candidatus Parcubacteria bacterium]
MRLLSKTNLSHIIFILIITLALVLRFYNISNVPPSASLDEASIGYNAYSILQTGADEYGNRFPVLLRAYDDWRPSLYVYLVIPFIKLFGLDVLSVRLPSVILSLLTVIATYLLTKELFKKSNIKFEICLPRLFTKQIFRGNLKFEISEVAMLLLAISPWHIYISRLGHEVNTGLSFFIFALLFFFKDKIFFSLTFFTLSFMSYQSEKIFIPLFVLTLFFLYWNKLLTHKKELFFSSIFCLIITIPFIQATLSPQALVRFKATNAFTSQDERFIEKSKILARAVEENDLISMIVNNRRMVYSQIFLEGYFSHLNPNWLFSNFSEDRHKVPGLGLFYPWEAIFIVVGLILLIFQKFDYRIKLIIIAWSAFSIIPAAVTTDSPHAMRAFTVLPAPQIISALGLMHLLSFVKQKRKIIPVLFFSILILSSITYFWKQYFDIFPKTQSSSFQYSLAQVIKYAINNENSYDRVVFANKDNLYQSYMFFLFNSRYDPNKYQNLGGTISGGYNESHKIGKFEFRPIDWDKELRDNNTLYIGNVDEFGTDANIVNRFYELNGKETINAVN